jgi:hypothetical protein
MPKLLPSRIAPRCCRAPRSLPKVGIGRGLSRVRAAIGLGELRVESTGVLNSDVTIRLGQDWVEQLTLGRNQAQSL